MPAFVYAEKCDGCKGQARTACQYICPNDLMTLNKEIDAQTGKWECFTKPVVELIKA